LTVVSATSALLFSLFVISETFASKVVFSGPNRWKSLGTKSGLYGVWHCHDEALILLPVGLEVFCELLHEVSTELYSMMQNSHFRHILVEDELGCFHCTEALP
jgi:hypothetical protein